MQWFWLGLMVIVFAVGYVAVVTVRQRRQRAVADQARLRRVVYDAVPPRDRTVYRPAPRTQQQPRRRMPEMPARKRREDDDDDGTTLATYAALFAAHATPTPHNDTPVDHTAVHHDDTSSFFDGGQSGGGGSGGGFDNGGDGDGGNGGD